MIQNRNMIPTENARLLQLLIHLKISRHPKTKSISSREPPYQAIISHEDHTGLVLHSYITESQKSKLLPVSSIIKVTFPIKDHKRLYRVVMWLGYKECGFS